MIEKWVKESDNLWRSTEDKNITIVIHEENTSEYYEEETESVMFMIFPAKNGVGIPNSPEVITEWDYGSYNEALKKAQQIAQEIMQLPIEKIRRTN